VTIPRSRRAVGIACAAVSVAVLAGAAILVTIRPVAPTATPVPSPLPVVQTPWPTPTPAPSGTPPAITPAATTSLPPAGSYPVVDSCESSSVPWAVPVPGSPTINPGSFTLHVPVLEYHRIVPAVEAGNSVPGLVVSPERFSQQLDALQKAGWHTITIAQLADDLAAQLTPVPKTFAITFDDGWDDGYTYALPILQKHGFVGTFFVIAGRIDHPGFLSSAHLLALIAAGDEIGDHTMDHTELSSVSPSRMSFEVDAAAARIAQVTGYWPESLAYPYGGVDARVKDVVARCRQLRIAVLDGPLTMTYPAPSVAAGATGAPARVEHLEAYETAGDPFDVPRIKVGPSMTGAQVMARMGPSPT
jgi:peptidoglycan/xylan/chitin deacetylase (PgdA/CDA1 family)